MKKSISIACLALILIAPSALANDPPPETAEKSETVDPIKRSDFVRTQYELFNKADKNFDGQVTTDEILRHSHDRRKPKYVSAFKAVDTNNNGFLSSEEIEAKHEEFTARQIEGLSKSRDNMLKRYDQDGNGTITSRELDAYFERMSQDRRDRTAQNAAKDMKAKDLDKSGSVSLDEYLESKTQASVQLARRPHLAGLDITRDPNGDKIIKRSENEAFVSRLFQALDKNKDDELSASEQTNSIFKQAASLSTRTLYLTDRKASVFMTE